MVVLIVIAMISGVFAPSRVQSQGPVTGEGPNTSTASLIKASTLRLTGSVDSNSPAVWDLTNGRPTLHVFTSWGGEPSRAVGSDLLRLGAARKVDLSPWPEGGNWIEAVIKDEDGTLYGYYHNERQASFCPGSDKAVPRIGALRSADQGVTWENLGIILEAPPGFSACDTSNRYFVGGVGDFSVMLDADSRDLYIFFSQYLRPVSLQGVGIARLAWADRDQPVGKVTVRYRGVWLPARRFMLPGGEGTSNLRWIYPVGTPLYPAVESWHDDDTEVDAFWGPSVHWNTYLQQYVMLLNKAMDTDFAAEGIYVAFSPRLDDPTLWSTPTRILEGGSWYPQVIGLEPGAGTDKVAGAVARLFIGGRSDYLIQFRN